MPLSFYVLILKQGCWFSVIVCFFRYFWPDPFSTDPFPVFRYSLFSPISSFSFWTFFLFLCSFSVRRHAHVDFQLFSQKSSGIPVKRFKKFFFMVFSLTGFCSSWNMNVILISLWWLPLSGFVITWQFVILPLWLLKAKSVWFLVSPSGDSQVQSLFFGFWKSVFAMISLCSSANSIKWSPLSFLSPVLSASMLLKSSFVLVPIVALKSPVMIFYFESLWDIALSASS